MYAPHLIEDPWLQGASEDEASSKEGSLQLGIGPPRDQPAGSVDHSLQRQGMMLTPPISSGIAVSPLPRPHCGNLRLRETAGISPHCGSPRGTPRAAAPDAALSATTAELESREER